MFCKRRSLDHFASTVVLPLSLILSACGGGTSGTNVASIPPPPPTPAPTPTPTPTPSGTIDVQTSWLDSPATRNGSYGVLGRLTLTPAVDGA